MGERGRADGRLEVDPPEPGLAARGPAEPPPSDPEPPSREPEGPEADGLEPRPTEPRETPPLFERPPNIEGLPRRKVVVELDASTVIYLGAGVLAAWLSLAMFRAASEFLAPIAVGIVLALALDQPVSRIKARLGCRRSVAVVMVCLALTVSTTALVVFLGPPAAEQAASFGEDLPDTVQDMYGLPIVGPRLEEADASEQVDEWMDDLPSEVDSQAVSDVVNRFVGGVATAVTVVLVAFAVLFDGELIVSRLRRAIPYRHRDRAAWLGGVFYRTFGRYFAGALLMAIMAGVYVLTVALILGVPLAPVVAIWAAITNLVPQVGGLLGGSVFVLLALTVGVTTGLLVLLLFMTYNSVENYVIQPTVVGGAVQLSPPATMIAALVGGVSAGVPGALIATPLVATAKAAYMEFRFGAPSEDQLASPELPVVTPLRRLIRRLRARLGRRR